jgi:putative ATPase
MKSEGERAPAGPETPGRRHESVGAMATRRRPGQDGDLFSAQERARFLRAAPLAARMRPRTLAEFLGQEHVVGAGRMLRRALERDAVPSLILWGPPGSGKTTLAGLIAAATGAHWEPLSAVTAGVADLRRVVQEARARRRDAGRRTILFIDEIHRFNKAQQDVILPHVEDGTVTLIGATTENPSFEVIAPLLSRCRVVVLRALADEEIAALVRRALTDAERGLGGRGIAIDDAAVDLLAVSAGGDARVALNALEVAAALAGDGGRIDVARVREALQSRSPRYEKAGESHYDTISAFIKSIRDSDPDAAIYWLARMLAGGEDPLFVARRLVILASEDVGLADTHALPLAVAAQQAAHFVGMPEAMYPLAHATLYLATAPKSNSVGSAYFAALKDVERTLNDPVPLHLRNAVTGLMKQLGYGTGYRYAHDHSAGRATGDTPGAPLHDNLPARLRGATYYRPRPFGDEARAKRWLDEQRAGRP